MLKNYMTVALRNLRRHPGHTAINVLGLTLGIACCLLILLYVQNERSYDRYHEKADRIYRITEIIESDGVGERSASAPFPTAVALQNDFPGRVEAAVRFFNFQAPMLTLAVNDDRAFNERRLFFADSTVFQVFDFPLTQGNPTTVLSEPNTIVLTESMAEKYFGDADPLGRVLRFQDEHDLRVTGIMADLPITSHFQIDFLASFTTLNLIYNEGVLNNWYWNPCWTYVLLSEGTTPESLTAEFPGFIDQYFPDVIKSDLTLRLQPLTDIHLHSRLDYEIEPNGNAANVYIFSAIALFILLIACINFMNLATARAADRAREVGMRKVLGAHRGQLVRQFLWESILLSLVSVLLALLLVQIVLPGFNIAFDKELSLNTLNTSWLVLGLLGLGLVVGTGAGLYPALYLSAFRPARILKGKVDPSRRGLSFRQVLVVAQFGISIMLMIGTGVAYNQLSHLLSADTGFEKEQVVMLPVLRSPLAPQFEAFKQEALQHPDIVSVTALEEILGAKHQGGNYQFEGMTESRLFPRLNVRHDFAQTFGIEMAAGRDYDPALPNDQRGSLVVNESLTRHLGWDRPEDAIGTTFNPGQRDGQIVGVMKDFHFTSLHQPISPLVLELDTRPEAFRLFIKYAAIRLESGDPGEALAHLEETWKTFAPSRPFDYFFLDDNLRDLYVAENNLRKVTTAFSILAILVACLGLLGLAAFTAARRTKEIGVRKVLGATVPNIVVLISKEFALLVVVAFLIAAPVAYVALNQWLDDFAYRIELSWPVFVIAGLAALVVALLTVSYQAIRAALIDPVESLRYE